MTDRSPVPSCPPLGPSQRLFLDEDFDAAQALHLRSSSGSDGVQAPLCQIQGESGRSYYLDLSSPSTAPGTPQELEARRRDARLTYADYLELVVTLAMVKTSVNQAKRVSADTHARGVGHALARNPLATFGAAAGGALLLFGVGAPWSAHTAPYWLSLGGKDLQPVVYYELFALKRQAGLCGPLKVPNEKGDWNLLWREMVGKYIPAALGMGASIYFGLNAAIQSQEGSNPTSAPLNTQEMPDVGQIASIGTMDKEQLQAFTTDLRGKLREADQELVVLTQELGALRTTRDGTSTDWSAHPLLWGMVAGAGTLGTIKGFGALMSALHDFQLFGPRSFPRSTAIKQLAAGKALDILTDPRQSQLVRCPKFSLKPQALEIPVSETADQPDLTPVVWALGDGVILVTLGRALTSLAIAIPALAAL